YFHCKPSLCSQIWTRIFFAISCLLSKGYSIRSSFLLIYVTILLLLAKPIFDFLTLLMTIASKFFLFNLSNPYSKTFVFQLQIRLEIALFFALPKRLKYLVYVPSRWIDYLVVFSLYSHMFQLAYNLKQQLF